MGGVKSLPGGAQLKRRPAAGFWMTIVMAVVVCCRPVQAGPTLYALYSTSDMQHLLCPNPKAHWERDYAPSGAHTINDEWQRGLRSQWYVEEQRYAMAPLICGILLHNPAAIALGFRAWDWAFARTDPEGGFSTSADAFHSSSFFVESVAESLIVLRQSPEAARYSSQIADYSERLHRAARWMIEPAVWDKGTLRNRPYTHRRYLVAAALGMTASLTNDRYLSAKADEMIEDGLRLQTSEGFNPEKGGFDSSYNAVGLLFAEKWLITFPQDPLAPGVQAMLARSLAWEETRIAPDGTALAEGNTRTNGQEKGRAGQVKTVSVGSIRQAFMLWGLLTNEPRWQEKAKAVRP